MDHPSPASLNCICQPPQQHHNPPLNFRDYMISKQDKLKHQFQGDALKESASIKPAVFEGVHVYVNGYTEPDSLTIKNMLAAHGGVWEQYNGSHVTHIVASQLPHSKIQKFLNAANPKNVVKPDWVVACVEAGQKLPEHNYLLIGPNLASTSFGSVDGAKNEVLSKASPVIQQRRLESDEEGDAGEIPFSSDDDGPFEAVADTIHLAPAAAAASDSVPSFPDPGINGKSTEAWVAQFFAQSRLHYIGSWQQRYERIKASCTVPVIEQPNAGRMWTLHVDMDCFFVSVSLKFRPDLVGQPVVVSHGRKTGATGEISCASYEARQCGVRAGMFMKRALELCPTLQVIPYEFQLYDDASEQVYRVLLGITSSVEAVSCDEAFLFVRTSDPETIIRRVREEVLKASGCVCSVGCSDSGKLIARMATRSAKPNGFRVVNSAVVPIQDFLDPLPVGDIPGVGFSTKQKLQAAGLNLCRNIRLCSAETVKSLLGPALGLKLHRICCGIDTLPIGADLTNSGECSNIGRIKDSIGVQMSWGVRLSSIPHVHIFFRCLAVELCTRAANAKVRGSLLTLKLWIKSDGAPEAKKHMGHGICYQVSKSGALPQLSTEATVNHVMPAVIACFDKCIAGIRTLTAEDIRGVGITMSRLQQLSRDIPVVQPVKFARNQDPVELIRSSHQPPINFSLMPPPQVSKVLRTASDSSIVKRTRESPFQNAYHSVLAPAEKRQMRELPISSSQLDHNVLAALSPELRRQVQDDAEKISALKRQNREFNRRSTFSVQVLEHDNDIQVTNSCIRPEDLSCHVFVEASSTGNAALEETLQMKRSIADWMAIGPPAASDVKLVGGIIRSLVAARFMDSLRSFLLALARCAHSFEAADERRRLWVEWVGRAIEFAQKKIFAEHGALCLL